MISSSNFQKSTKKCEGGSENRPPKSCIGWVFRLLLLFILFVTFFVLGSMAVEEVIPDDAPS
jgi:hypothetical protein